MADSVTQVTKKMQLIERTTLQKARSRKERTGTAEAAKAPTREAFEARESGLDFSLTHFLE